MVSKPNTLSIGTKEFVQCANCSKTIPNVGFIDHHGGICPYCKVKYIFFSLALDVNKLIQIIPAEAPVPLQKFIHWAQKDLDELEFIELLSCFKEIVDPPN